MDVLLFKQDLDNYSDGDIAKLAKRYSIQAPMTDLRWLIAIQHAEKRANMFTNDPNINERIFEEMDNDTLLNYCNASKTNHKECEPFFEKLVKNFGYNGKLTPAKNWQQIYIVLNKYKDLFLIKDEYNKLSKLNNVGELDNEQKNVYDYYNEMSESLIRKTIKLNMTNITEWLMNIGIIDTTYNLYDFYLIATKYCKPDILKMFYKYLDRTNQKHLTIKETPDNFFNMQLDDIYIHILNKNNCPNLVEVMKFWYDYYDILPGSNVVNHSQKKGLRDVLDYLVKLGVTPSAKKHYNANVNKLSEIQWLIDMD